MGRRAAAGSPSPRAPGAPGEALRAPHWPPRGSPAGGQFRSAPNRLEQEVERVRAERAGHGELDLARESLEPPHRLPVRSPEQHAAVPRHVRGPDGDSLPRKVLGRRVQPRRQRAQLPCHEGAVLDDAGPEREVDPAATRSTTFPVNTTSTEMPGCSAVNRVSSTASTARPRFSGAVSRTWPRAASVSSEARSRASSSAVIPREARS